MKPLWLFALLFSGVLWCTFQSYPCAGETKYYTSFYLCILKRIFEGNSYCAALCHQHNYFFHNKGSQISLNFNHKKSNKLILLGHQTFWTLGICLWNDAWTTSYENRLVFHLTLNWQSYFIHLPCKKSFKTGFFL